MKVPPKALNAAWRDITLKVTREIIAIIEKFISENHMRSKMKICVDESIFVVRITKFGVVTFAADGDLVGRDTFFEEIDTYIYSAKNVYYKITKFIKFIDPPINILAKSIAEVIDTQKVDEQIIVEVCKVQTFTSIQIDRITSPMFDGYLMYNSIINIIDVYDDVGVVNNDLLINVLETRPAIYEDSIRTISKKKVVSEVRRLLKTTEPESPITAQVVHVYGSCLLNLTTQHLTYGDVKMTLEAIEDRYRYNKIKDYIFADEILEAAWHPDRYREWCLDDEERRRIESYRQIEYN